MKFVNRLGKPIVQSEGLCTSININSWTRFFFYNKWMDWTIFGNRDSRSHYTEAPLGGIIKLGRQH